MSVLLIHPRKGYFQITKCSNCDYIFECDYCSSPLITYKLGLDNFEQVCRQCQTYYKYPKSCPNCKSQNIVSSRGGVQNLEEILKLNELESVDITGLKKISYDKEKIYITTRIFDPSIDYSYFEKIIFIQSQNLLASPDYLVIEEITKSLMDLFLSLTEKTNVYFDGYGFNLNYFKDLINNQKDLSNWYQNLFNQEIINRKNFKLYPDLNLLLITSHQKTKIKSIQILKNFKKELILNQKDFPEILFEDIYPAKLIKRKNFFSFHLLIKYPKNYEKFYKFQQLIFRIQKVYRVQIRLNPRHLF